MKHAALHDAGKKFRAEKAGSLLRKEVALIPKEPWRADELLGNLT